MKFVVLVFAYVVLANVIVPTKFVLDQRQSFQLVATQMVIQEASAEDTVAPQKQLEVLKNIELLEVSENAVNLVLVE